MRRLIGVLLFGCGSPAAPAHVEVARPDPKPVATIAVADPAPVPLPHDGCLAKNEYAAYSKAVEARNEAVFQNALARQNLAPVKLAVHTWPQERPTGPPADPVRTIDGKRMILVGSGGASCGAKIEDGFLFAQSGSRIVRIDRRVRTHRLEVLVCPNTSCEREGPMCGGAAIRMVGVGFELPPGSTFDGTVSIDVDADWVQPSPKSPPGVACPPPQMPP